MKRLIAFDLDGALTESKSFIHREMVDLILDLLKDDKVAVILGALN